MFSLHTPGFLHGRGVKDAGILVNNLEARRMQQSLGGTFMHVAQAVSGLHTGIQCRVNPIITLSVTPEAVEFVSGSRALVSHLVRQTVVLGVASRGTRQVTVGDINMVLLDALKEILRSDDDNPSVPLTVLGLDSFGFVSTAKNAGTLIWLLGSS